MALGCRDPTRAGHRPFVSRTALLYIGPLVYTIVRQKYAGPVRSNRPTILAYHAIANLAHDPNGTATSPKRFRSQMSYLRRHNLLGVSIRELRRAMEAGEDVRRLVGLTFDDGSADFLHTALPVLEEMGFFATVYVVAGMIGRENGWEHVYEPRPRLRLLTAAELREVAKRGMEVGSHTMTHRRLSELDWQAVEREVEKSRRVLGEVLGEAIEGLSYPYGSFSDTAIEAARRAGYTYACAWNVEPTWRRFCLPRVPVSEKDGLCKFAMKIRFYWSYRKLNSKLRRPHAFTAA